MGKYHVQCGLLEIYAGVQREDGSWRDKDQVTKEARSAVVDWKKKLMEERYEHRSIEKYKFLDGKVLTVEYRLEGRDYQS